MTSTDNHVADTICRTTELGLAITHAYAEEAITHICAYPVRVDSRCPACRKVRRLRDHRVKTVVDIPAFGHPVRLHIRCPRYCCTNDACGRKIFQPRLACCSSTCKLTCRAIAWIEKKLACDHHSISAIARALAIGWDLVNRIAARLVESRVRDNPNRLDGVFYLGVDEHVWKQTHRVGQPSSFVTIMVDITPTVTNTGPARLIDIRPGRSAQVFASWLGEQTPQFRDQVTVVTMDGFQGYATATTTMLPPATKVMDPFHVVHLAALKLTASRQRIQQITTGARGKKTDLLYTSRRRLLTRKALLTDTQKNALKALWLADENHSVVEVTWHFTKTSSALTSIPINMLAEN